MCQSNRTCYFLCALMLALMLNVQVAYSSSVIPPRNFGELVRISDLVVVARADGSTGFKRGELIMTNNSFTVIDVIKGSAVVGSSIHAETFGGLFGDMGLSIGGSPVFVEGDVYLLSLSEFNGQWTFRFMSYGVMVQRRMVTGQQVFTHLENAHELNIIVPDGRDVEPITTYASSAVVPLLKQIANGTKTWSRDEAGEVANAGHDGALKSNSILGTHAAPPGCVYINNPGTPVRWRRFEQSLSVNVKVVAGAPANVVTAVQNSVDAWKNIPGIDMGTLSFAGNNPVHGSCPVFSNANFNAISDGDSHIFLDDPCTEITDLVGCNGTLAIAGPAFFNTPHVRNGENWLEAIRGIMIVNNGTPGCLSTAEYEQTITHELGHILGFGHHTGGTANMNAMCCSPITAVDQTCAFYPYGTGAANPLPVITSLNPNNADQGTSNLAVQIIGTDFVNGGSIGISSGGISINSASFVNSTTINMNISISAGATAGARNVTYTNPAPGGGQSNVAVFTVNQLPNPVPTLTSVSPNTGQQGDAVSVTLTGTNFVPGATVQVSGSGISVSNVSVTNSTTMTALFTIMAGATPGARDVTVTNPAPGGGTSASRTFTVTELFVNKAPTMNVISDLSFLHTAPEQAVNLSGISPGAGENQSLTITATAANPLLIPTLSVQYISPLTTGTLRLQNDRTRVGSTTITVRLKDSGGTANGGVDTLIRVFTVNVNLDTNLETDEPDIPTEYDMLQNYPNPFNPSTVIPFLLPGRANVTIGVYDLTGRLRMTLLQQEMSAGRHEVQLDASDFGSGLYLVRMTSEFGIKSVMIMLVK